MSLEEAEMRYQEAAGRLLLHQPALVSRDGKRSVAVPAGMALDPGFGMQLDHRASVHAKPNRLGPVGRGRHAGRPTGAVNGVPANVARCLGARGQRHPARRRARRLALPVTRGCVGQRGARALCRLRASLLAGGPVVVMVMVAGAAGIVHVEGVAGREVRHGVEARDDAVNLAAVFDIRLM